MLFNQTPKEESGMVSATFYDANGNPIIASTTMSVVDGVQNVGFIKMTLKIVNDGDVTLTNTVKFSGDEKVVDSFNVLTCAVPKYNHPPNRICPDVLTKLYVLRETGCELTFSGDGCGSNQVNSFNTMAECKNVETKYCKNPTPFVLEPQQKFVLDSRMVSVNDLGIGNHVIKATLTSTYLDENGKEQTIIVSDQKTFEVKPDPLNPVHPSVRIILDTNTPQIIPMSCGGLQGIGCPSGMMCITPDCGNDLGGVCVSNNDLAEQKSMQEYVNSICTGYCDSEVKCAVGYKCMMRYPNCPLGATTCPKPTGECVMM